MEVVPLDTGDDVARLAADIVESLVRRTPAAVLGLATGSSPVPAYRELARRHSAGTAPPYDAVRCFTLDEYIGLPAGHPQTYRETIFRELTDALGIAREQVASPDPEPAGLPRAGERYEAAIRSAGGIDLQVVGIGTDGHLAFNEPGSSLSSSTRLKTLTEQTRCDNARFFDSLDDVPRHVLTQGLGTILRARHVLLVATGESKAPAVASAIEGALSASCPASVLQLHPRCTVVLDAGAAAGLARADHYREVHAAKPSWQAYG